MANPVQQYKTNVEQSGPVMKQDYANNQPPFKGNPSAGVPSSIAADPVDDSGNALVPAAECPYKYAELQLPDGKTYLAIITPWTITGGPGLHYVCEEA